MESPIFKSKTTISSIVACPKGSIEKDDRLGNGRREWIQIAQFVATTDLLRKKPPERRFF
jgi:hypothetical protein